MGIEVAIITGEKSNSVINRAKKLKIGNCFTGVKNKVKVAENLIKKLNIDSFENVAFIGDDINDFHLIKKVGLSACPSQASSLIKKNVDWILNVKGGDGVFRFFVEYFREPDEHIGLIYLDFSMGQILSLPMIISGLYFIIIFNKKKIRY